MKKEIFKKIVIFVCKYLVPAFLGWLEGSSNVISEPVSEMLSFI